VLLPLQVPFLGDVAEKRLLAALRKRVLLRRLFSRLFLVVS
jgi:hypothetical protein